MNVGQAFVITSLTHPPIRAGYIIFPSSLSFLVPNWQVSLGEQNDLVMVNVLPVWGEGGGGGDENGDCCDGGCGNSGDGCDNGCDSRLEVVVMESDASKWIVSRLYSS